MKDGLRFRTRNLYRKFDFWKRNYFRLKLETFFAIGIDKYLPVLPDYRTAVVFSADMLMFLRFLVADIRMMVSAFSV